MMFLIIFYSIMAGNRQRLAKDTVACFRHRRAVSAVSLFSGSAIV
jgi:hypothetical protein